MNIALIFNTIKKHVNLEHCVIRFIMAWCFICYAESVIIEITTENKISSISYVGEIPLAVHLLVIAVFFVFIYFIFELINKMFVEKLSLYAAFNSNYFGRIFYIVYGRLYGAACSCI